MPIDVVSFGETMLRLTAPQGTRLENVEALRIYVGGTESNTLSSLARLDLQVSWISALPAHPLGRRIAHELRGHGVDISHVVWMEHGSRLGIFYAEEAPNPPGIQVYYDRANSACALVDPDVVSYDVVDQARVLHLTGITPALSASASEVFRRFLQRAAAQRVALSFDVNYRAKLWSPAEAAASLEDACRQARILFCARADATELWGFSGDPEHILRQMAARFAVPGQPKTLVLTLGSAGSAQLQDGEYALEPCIPTEGNARFGSGDAFAAGYLYAYLDGPLYREMRPAGVTALALGNALAALKRSIDGDIAIITPDDVRALLQKQEGQRFR